MAMIVVGFPLLLLAAAGSKPLSPRLSRFSGGLSYPLYILHVPLAGLLTPWLLHLGLTPGWALYGLEIILIAALSYATLLAYDEPLRARLRHAYGSRRHR
jgi:peptidoglycan/LPS O-acetylase OafA/YrhL